MGVLEGHAPMIVMLRGGAISLYEGDRVTDTMFVAGGFAEVTPERCTVLANEVMPVAERRARKKASAAWPRPRRAYAAIDGSRHRRARNWRWSAQQSARALIEAVDGLLTGSR